MFYMRLFACFLSVPYFIRAARVKFRCDRISWKIFISRSKWWICIYRKLPISTIKTLTFFFSSLHAHTIQLMLIADLEASHAVASYSHTFLIFKHWLSSIEICTHCTQCHAMPCHAKWYIQVEAWLRKSQVISKFGGSACEYNVRKKRCKTSKPKKRYQDARKIEMMKNGWNNFKNSFPKWMDFIYFRCRKIK